MSYKLFSAHHRHHHHEHHHLYFPTRTENMKNTKLIFQHKTLCTNSIMHIYNAYCNNITYFFSVPVIYSWCKMCVHTMNKRIVEFKHTYTLTQQKQRDAQRTQHTHTLKRLVRVPNQKRMISNDHCVQCSVHVAISLWALNIKDDYERAHMCEHANACIRVCGIHAIYIRALALSLLLCCSHNHIPDSNVITLHICSVQTQHCECLIFGCHAWICAHFFLVRFFWFYSYTDRFNMTSCHYGEALHIS